MAASRRPELGLESLLRPSPFLLGGLGFILAVGILPGALNAGTALRWALLAVCIPFFFSIAGAAFPRLLGGLGAVIVAWACFSAAWAPDPLAGLDEAVHLAILAGAFCLGAALADLSGLWLGIALGMAVSAAVAAAQHFGGLLWIPSATEHSGLFINRNPMAEAAAMSLAAVATMGVRRFWWALPGPAAALYLGGSRAAVGALVLAGLIACLRSSKLRGPAVAGMLALLAVALWQLLATQGGGHMRIEEWGAAISDPRLLGHGLGAFAFTFPFDQYAHSEPLQAFYELGILAVPFALILARALFWGDIRAPEHSVLVVVLGVSCFAFPFHLPVTAFAAAAAAGHLLRRRDLVRLREPGRGVALA